MKNTQFIHDQVLAKLISDSQSTHDIAVQATAGRLLRLLEERYTYLGSGEPSREAQEQLKDYIVQTGAKLEDESVAPVEMIQIGGEPHPVARLITTMLTLDIELLDKKNVLMQLQHLANKHPNNTVVWTLKDTQWAMNAVYNNQSSMMESVSSSPAKTLSLVCAAMLDGLHHDNESIVDSGLPSSSSFVQPITKEHEEKRIRQMATALTECLLRLQGGERNKCSGGQQHDLLWLLQGSYLDENHRPFEFIDSLPAFLTGLVTSFIQKQLLPRATEDERFNLMREWKIFSTTLNDLKNPLLAMLERHHGESWRDICKQWMNESCARVGISPEIHSASISSMANSMDELSIPIQNNPQAQLVWELYSTTPIMHCTHRMQKLVEARNLAMQRFRAEVSAGNWNALVKNHQGIADLYTAETLFQSMQRYASMALVGSEDTHILEAGQPMTVALLDYFSRYEIDRRLPESFEQAKAEYFVLEKEFKEQSHEGVITLFFQAMKTTTPTDFNSYWARIQVIPGLQLSDESIWKVLNQHLIEDQITLQEELPHQLKSTQTITTELSTYDINRLLLHGLHVPPKSWSETYKQTISSVCQWLLSPKLERDSLSMVAVKQGYPHYLLANIFLQTLLTGELQELLSEQQDASGLLFIDKLSQYCKSPDAQKNKQLFSAISPYFNLLIQNCVQLHHLLLIGKNQFNSKKCRQLWEATKDNLSTIFQNGQQIYAFLMFNSKIFNEVERTQLWNAIKNNLSVMIQNGVQLCNLLWCSNDQFNIEQRNQLWEAIKSNLPIIIQNGTQLRDLLELNFKQLNIEQRIELWGAIKNNLARIVQDGKQLHGLFALGWNKFDREQRSQLWEIIKNDLSQIIQDGQELYDLFALGSELLTIDQRKQIWDAVKSNLPVLFKTIYPFRNLLDLGWNKFDKEQRLQLWEIIKSNLPALITDGLGLESLFRLDFEKFDSDRREYVWDIIQKNLSSIVKSGYQLSSLFALDFDKFNQNKRTQLWKAVINNLTELIQDGMDLGSLFELNLKQFTTVQRMQLWDAIQHNLATIIREAHPLRDILALGFEQFNDLQRIQLWDVIKNNIPAIIRNVYDLIIVLDLDFTQLNQTHRIEIFDALKEIGWSESKLKEIYRDCSRESLVNVSVTTQTMFSFSDASCSMPTRSQAELESVLSPSM